VDISPVGGNRFIHIEPGGAADTMRCLTNIEVPIGAGEDHRGDSTDANLGDTIGLSVVCRMLVV
jgi:hypothetical protein